MKILYSRSDLHLYLQPLALSIIRFRMFKVAVSNRSLENKVMKLVRIGLHKILFFLGLSWAVCLGRAGPGRSENCDGPGRAETFENVMDWAGPGRDCLNFDGPGRSAAHPLEI